MRTFCRASWQFPRSPLPLSEDLVATLEADGDVEGLVHGPGRRVVGSQEPGRADQHVPGRIGSPALLVLLQRRTRLGGHTVESPVQHRHGLPIMTTRMAVRSSDCIPFPSQSCERCSRIWQTAPSLQSAAPHRPSRALPPSLPLRMARPVPRPLDCESFPPRGSPAVTPRPL